MTLPRSAADVLADHVTFELESIDRMYCNVYQPRLQHPKAVAGFIRHHLGMPVASSAALAPISEAFIDAVKSFAVRRHIPVVDFVKGQRKDDVMHEHLARFTRAEGVLFIGRAQEKISVFRTERRRDADGVAYPWIVKTTAMVNQWYFYCVDADFGPFFIKFSSYFPYNARLCLNGHEYAKRQAARAGIGFTALDNGFAAVDDPAAVQAICDGLSAEVIDGLLRKWLAILPHPYTDADRAAGFDYQISILQVEFSLTQVLDSPRAGRVFFDDVIRHNLDLGRPDQVALIFDRQIRRRGQHPTPGRWRTRVITEGVTPSLHIDFKHAKIKQYHKLGAALRTETTINDTYDFRIGRGLHNLPALRQVGFPANRRLLDVQTTSHDPFIGTTRLAEISGPVIVDGDRKTSGLRFGDAVVHALLACLLGLRLNVDGFTNADLRTRLTQALNHTGISPGQMTYQLRRLRLHGLIRRIPGSFRYRLTDTGLTTAVAYTLAHDRVLRTGTAHLTDPLLPTPLRREYNRLAAQSCLAA
jgi:hypothetical protein